MDVITDFYSTAFEQSCLLMSLVNISAELNMIDEDILRS